MNFYFEAAKTLDRLDSKQGSIKGVLASLPEKNRKRTTALVIETLKCKVEGIIRILNHKVVLTDIIEEAKLLKEERKITSLNLALVLVHDLLLSGGIQAGDGPVKQAILRHKTRLHGELQKIKIKRGVKTDTELAQTADPRAARIPRHVRVNTLIWSTDEAVKSLMSQGFIVSDPFESEWVCLPNFTADTPLIPLLYATRTSFMRDKHIPDLLSFSPRVTFHDDPLYTAGKIILQDKASCFPATVLAPPANDNTFVIDATSAPGNKTSHLSALMKNKGKVSDFGAHNGSGIVNRLDHLLETEIEDDGDQEDRLKRLASFQVMMVKHAMRCEPIVYVEWLF
ncbi:hypothetical protein C0989_005788 [Termitomyces sp. Mn162]|nr:hypothetical protein C0989_005788 [Termitomyces sp. Mn162]